MSTFERRFLWPALCAWSVVAALLILAIAADALLPPPLRPVRRLLTFRDNLRAVDWLAAQRAQAQIPPGRYVVVDSDRDEFFYNLRYRSYPTWVLRAGEPGRASPPESTACRVTYRDDVLRIEEDRSR